MPEPGVAPDALAVPFLKTSGATWGRWSPGERESALWSRAVYSRVPPTTLSAICLDFAQQPERVSEPKCPACWADLHGPSPGVSGTPFFSLRPPATHQPSPPDHSALTPPHRASEPHTVTSAVPSLCTTCCAIMSGHFASAPTQGHGQVLEEHERWSEKGESVPGLSTFLAWSPGTHGAVATGPAVVLCTTGTLQPPVCTLGEDVTLYVVEAVKGGVALVDRDEVGIVREHQILAEDVMEEVEIVVGTGVLPGT